MTTVTVRKGSQNRHERVAQLLRSGKVVTVKEIQDHFAGTDQESVLYRLPTNIYNIRLDGGVIKVHKKGRKVDAYQLVNASSFDDIGRFIQDTK